MRHLDSIRPLAERVQILSGRAGDGGLYASLTADEATGRPVLEDVLVNGRLVRRPKLVVNGLKAFFEQALAGADTAEKAMELGRRQAAVFREALEDQTGRKQQALNALRVTTVDNYIRAKSNWALFFRPVTLADDESPVFRHTYRNEVTIRFLGEDGSVQTVRAVGAQKLVYPDLRLLSSERVGYPVRDIYNGDISVAAQRTVDIGFDLAGKVDAECKRLLDGCFGAFTTAGEKLDRTYVKNTRVVGANLPATNDLTLPDNGPSTKFRLQCLTAALRYCAQWTGLFPDGDLAPTGVVIVPSIDAADIADQFSPTGNYSSEVSNQVLAGGFMSFDYMGRRWTIVPDPTISSGTCYPVLNKATGEIYSKPSWDNEFVFPNDPQERIAKNWEERQQTKLIGLACPEPWNVNVCRVTYKQA